MLGSGAITVKRVRALNAVVVVMATYQSWKASDGRLNEAVRT